jgi:N4-(beta-N-acetylglucosaminyl)-L-asparaginase
MNVTRRRFVIAACAAPLLRILPRESAAADSSANSAFHWSTPDRPLIISTWPFGKAANDRALEVLRDNGSVLDAVEKGINVTESDESNRSVGLSGTPNAEGVVQLDACIIDGPSAKAGSVAAIERIAHPISVARRVMEKTKNVMLVGAGAQEFAVKQGFELAPAPGGSSPKAAPAPGSEGNHDTIALIALGKDGTLAGGCSTSGLGHKLPGRVGDSPIIGSGLYVDNDIGGAGATGVGENVMRFCATFMIVEYMRQGLHPTEACIAAIKRIQAKHPPHTDLSISFVALNNKGEYGAAGTGNGFPFSITGPGFSKVLHSAAVP